MPEHEEDAGVDGVDQTFAQWFSLHLFDQLMAVLDIPQLRLELVYHFLEWPCGLVRFSCLVFLRPCSSGPMFVQLGHPTLEEGAKEGRASGIAHIPDETEM